MDLLKLNENGNGAGEERIIAFLRRNSLDWDVVRGQLLDETQDDQLFLKSWCQKIIHWLDGSVLSLDLDLDYEDRLLRLESDKDTLHLQVSLLSRQIQAQKVKIQDLERMLEDKKNIVESAEERLQKELITKSGLDTQRLELMTEISGLRLKQATLERENFELRGRFGYGIGIGIATVSGSGRSLTDLNYGESRFWDKPPVPVSSSAGTGTGVRSPGARSMAETNFRERELRNRRSVERKTSDLGLGPKGQGQGQGWTTMTNQNQNQTPTPITYRHHPSSSFATLPRRSQPTMRTNLNCTFDTTRGMNPNNDNDNDMDNGHLTEPELSTFKAKPSNTNDSGGGGHKSRRILKILGKLKRSNSGGFDNDIYPEGQRQGQERNPFVRGGLRSTAIGVPRLGWQDSENSRDKIQLPEGPMSSWDSDAVVTWLNCIGLSMYTTDFKRWVKSGQQLLDASPQELEKELNIKNYLHRKKLNLALHAFRHPEEEDNPGKLDYQWVTRWLDDVGLPQYKASFIEARVDGRMLSGLTPEDLLALKVTSSMHHLSLKRGIQILRIHRFHPSCLCRRGRRGSNDPDIANIADVTDMSDEARSRGPAHVATWTNHRVMEWLKVVDLAEYAPNLRGSGVHGALLLFEPTFNAELLATLLSIPQNKTLLRRHLSLQFNDLVGRHVVQEKRLAEISTDYLPINPSLKVKVKAVKKSPFPLRKKRLSSEFSDGLLCPLDWDSFPASWELPELEQSDV